MGKGDERTCWSPLLLLAAVLAPPIGGGSAWMPLCAAEVLEIFRISEEMEEDDEECRDDADDTDDEP